MKKSILSIGTGVFTFGSVYYYNENSFPKISQNVHCKTIQNYFTFAVAMIPHPEKAHKGGEDAAFADQGLLAVADGVGGWANQGVDPAIYARNLMRSVQNMWSQDPQTYQKQPKKLIIDAWKPVTDLGSSTLVLCTIDEKEPILRSAYIGDSGYMILRPQDTQSLSQDNNNNNGYKRSQNNLGRNHTTQDLDGNQQQYYNIVYQSKEQQKGFNFPYQLGYRGNGDSPHEAWTFKHGVQDNDIVVVGSDGLFDNIYPEQIQAILNEQIMQKNQSVSKEIVMKAAQTIAEKTYDLSLDRLTMSPFAQKAREHRKMFMGGKSDDITIIIAQIHVNN